MTVSSREEMLSRDPWGRLSTARPRPQVHTFPHDDGVLALRLQEIVKNHEPADVDAARRVLIAALRLADPSVEVRPRSELATYTDERANGATRLVEFMTREDGGGPGRHVTVLRALD